MILIISEETDASTTAVVKWLLFRKVAVLRLNAGSDQKRPDLVRDISFTIDDQNTAPQLHFENATLAWNDIEACWYRRGDLLSSLPTIKVDRKNHTTPFIRSLVSEINEALTWEQKALRTFLHHLLKNKPGLDNFLTADAHKLSVLEQAKEHDFDIPKTLVTTSKEVLRSFWEECAHACITKAIQDVDAFTEFDEENQFGPYTETIAKEDIEALPEHFFPMLVQEKLDKAYELRIFYLMGACYAMAIFSQLDEQTSVDFRRYNHKRPNRCIAYSLPEAIAEKVDRLMRTLTLDTGSVDIVVTKDGRYVFLEVNPVGQFGMVSGPCNYYLEKKIADYLIHCSKTHERKPKTTPAA